MSKRSVFFPGVTLPPEHVVSGQVLMWSRAVAEQRERLLQVRVRKSAVSVESMGYIYDSTFFLVAMLNLIRSAREAHNIYKNAKIRDALRDFEKTFPEAEISKGRGVLNYAHRYAVGKGKQQRGEASGDFEIWWNESWDGETKTDFIVRVGEHFRISVNEAAEAAEKLAQIVYAVALEKLP